MLVGTAREAMRRFIGERGKLIGLVKRTQVDGTIRFDGRLAEEGAEAALQALKKEAVARGWHVRAHVSAAKRLAGCRNGKASKAEVGARRGRLLGGSLVTWNVGTAAGKTAEMAEMLQEQRAVFGAFQETLQKAKAYPLRLSGYTVIERPFVAGKPGARGLALAASNRITLHELCYQDDNAIWARAMGMPGGRDWIVACVYVPTVGSSNKERRAQVLAHIESTVQAVTQRFPGSPLVLMGDFNMTTVQLRVRMAELGMHARDLQGELHGSYKTAGGKMRDIDHIVVNESAREALGLGVVLDRYDLSTHFPVAARMAAAIAEAPASAAGDQPRIDPKAVLAAKGELACSNHFAALAVAEVTDTTVAAEAFNKAVFSACEAEGCMKARKVKSAPKRFSHSRSTKALIEGRRDLAQKLRREPLTEEQRAELKVKYAATLKRAREAQRRDERKRWLADLRKAVAAQGTGGDAKTFWRWVGKVVDGESAAGRGGAINPIKDDAGVLQTDPEVVLGLWHSYYRDLSAASKQKARRSKAEWAADADCALPQKSTLPRVCDDISWRDIVAAVKATCTGKAAGADGIPPEVLKAVIAHEDGSEATEDERKPTTAMGKAALRLARAIWDTGSIPEQMQDAILVAIPKAGGDPAVRNDHRGISLIAVLLKLLSRILADRMAQGLIKTRRIRREQAGFLSREECMGQVCALVDIVMRRQRAGKLTYACYIDFKKAFDLVPHGALLHRLESEGVRGRALQFIAALYEHSTLRVRVGDRLTERINLEQGVRQGDPLSPIIFNLFVNSILDELQGLEVHGVKGSRVPGLMFADDVVLLAESGAELAAALARVSTWADTWGMEIGHRKCGVMVFSYPQKGGQPHPAAVAAQEAAAEAQWVLQGEAVPFVREYKYLGVMIDHDMALDGNIAYRVKQATKALHRMRPFLCDRSVPLTIKADVYRTTVQPVLTFGGEVFGGRLERLLQPLQALQDQALRWMVGGGDISRRQVPAPLLHRDLGTSPVCAMAAGAKARALRKYPTLRTWIAVLCKAGAGRAIAEGSRRPWSSTSNYMARYAPDWLKLSPPCAARKVRLARAEAWHAAKAGKGERRAAGYEQYDDFGLAATRGFVRRSGPRVQDASNISWLVKARMAAYTRGYQQVEVGHLPAQYKQRCVACGTEARDNLLHLTCDCAAYASERQTFLIPLWQRQEDSASLSSGDRLRIALGGVQLEAGTPVTARWLPKSRKDEGHAGDDDGDSVGSGESSVVGGEAAGHEVAGAVAPAAVGVPAASVAGSVPGLDGAAGSVRSSGPEGEQPGYLLAARFYGAVLPRHHRCVWALIKGDQAQGDQGAQAPAAAGSENAGADGPVVHGPQHGGHDASDAEGAADGIAEASAGIPPANTGDVGARCPGVNAPEGVGQPYSMR